MPRYIPALLLLLPIAAHACLITRLLPNNHGKMSAEEIERYQVSEDVRKSAVVVEVTITGIKRTKEYTLYAVRPENIFKGDGAPIEELFAGRGYQCAPPDLERGGRYTLFSQRASNLLAGVGNKQLPLQIRWDTEVSTSARTSKALTEVLVIPMKINQ